MDLRGGWQTGTRASGPNRSPTERTTARGTAISWQLGDHLTNRSEVSRVAELDGSGGTRTVYDLTDETYLVRTRTPVGRERYREVPKHDIDA